MYIEVTFPGNSSGRTYLYRCNEPVNVGGEVMVPPTWVHPAEQQATVVAVNMPLPDHLAAHEVVEIRRVIHRS